jgi:hypothetical protein
MPKMKGFGLAGLVAVVIVMKTIMGWTDKETKRYEELERRAIV